MNIKQSFFYAALTLSVLLSACSGKSKSGDTESGQSGSDNPELAEYAVYTGYNISVPEDFIDKNLDPDRFSFYYGDESDKIGIGIEGDLPGDGREGYEERRMQDGSLEKYPYTLKGYSDFIVNDFKTRWQDVKEVNHKEVNINGMPAVINEIQCTLSMQGKSLPAHVYIANIEGSNGILYRITILSLKGALGYTDDVFNSFQVTE
ncbi:MAG: hypothetical protein LBE56_15050 [Tannerella sp.]|jgi:hypothetical protein|nr:hypothetical protein [Tannerella sp.]